MKTEKLTMRAKFDGLHASNARNYSGEKETINTLQVIGRVNGELRTVCTARFYMGRSRTASTVYCALWVDGPGYCSGKGTAGGYGYHKQSAALADAIRSAGITLTGANYAHMPEKLDFKKPAHIGGCGGGSMNTALKAIARAAGARGQLLIV